jgi:hypothetical protein
VAQEANLVARAAPHRRQYHHAGSGPLEVVNARHFDDGGDDGVVLLSLLLVGEERAGTILRQHNFAA